MMRYLCFLTVCGFIHAAVGTVPAQDAEPLPASLTGLPTPLESQPYNIRMLLSSDSSGLRDSIQTAADRSVGALWSLQLETDYRFQDAPSIARLTLDTVSESLQDSAVDFWFLIAAEQIGPRHRLTVRAWQPKFAWLSPVQRVEFFEGRELPQRIMQMCWKLFRPEIRVEQVDQNSVRARIPAGDLRPADPAYQLLQTGDYLIPWLMYYDRKQVLQRRQELPWTYVRIDQLAGPLANGTVLSGLRTPLAGKTRGRIEKVAVVARPIFSESRLQLGVQNQPARLLAGYRLELRPKLPAPKSVDNSQPAETENADEMQTILTDQLGETRLIPQTGHAFRWIYVYSGDLLLARVPFVIGSLDFQRLEVPDDSVRLRVEGQLQTLQSQLINLVAERNTLVAAAKAASKKDDWQRMTALRKQLDVLPTRQTFQNRLAGIRVPAINAAKARKDRSSQVRIDRLCNDVAELIDRYLDPEKLQQINDDLDELQKMAKSADTQ